MHTMQTSTLGRAGLQVSVAGLGCGGRSRLGQSHGASFEHSVDIVRTALDCGVTFIDTAAAYGTEKIIGEAIKGRRDEVVVSTKVKISEGSSVDPKNMIDANELENRVDGCLTRLGVDCIDVLHLHGIALEQYDYAIAECLPRLKLLQEKGKIRCLGLTERFSLDPHHTLATRAADEAYFDVLMIGLNYINHTALRSVLPAAKKNNIGVLCMFAVRGPLANRRTAEELVHLLIKRGEIDPASYEANDPLSFLTSAGVAKSLSEAAYRFCRHAPGIDVTITGTGNRTHLLENLRSINAGPLPVEAIDRLSASFGNVTSESGQY